MLKPTVSIVTPSYNQGEFIEETINSVLSQNYQNIEYIVVDGASTDNTVEILKKYASKIKWISEKDNGQADAINKGFRMTKGEIIYWLNSDDVLLPGSVSKIVDEYNNNPDVDIIYGKCHFTDVSNKIVGKYPTEIYNFRRLAMFNFICQPSAFFKRKAFFESGCLNEHLKYALDYDLWIRMAKKFNFKYLPEFLSCYRLHDASKTVDTKQALANNKETLNIVFKHYNWAPANRVYGYYYQLTESKMKLKNSKYISILFALFISTIKYLQFNKRFVMDDLRVVKISYIKKLFINWNDLYKSY